jgi:AcrR family transcriptional regulator
MGHEAAEFPADAGQPGRPAGAGRARSDTRERIQSVALELFAEHGYQQTSLREIAERLGVTKAALYYHFKSKEDIVRSFTEDYAAELDALLVWGADQPQTPATRAALLARYSDIVQRRLGVLRFLEQNQAAVHHLMSENGGRDHRRMFREQFENFGDVIAPPGAPLEERVRASVAVVSIGLGSMLFQKEAADPAALREIVLGIATELAGASPEPSLSPTATA